MRKVFKYTLGLISVPNIVEVQIGAKFLHAEMQFSQPCLWFEVDDEAETEDRRFIILGTGYIVPDDAEYVATVYNPDVAFVWHIYELK